MISIWSVESHAPVAVGSDRLPGGRFDAIIIGAGITGLVTGVILAREGCSVALVEARRVAALASGGNTGKATVLHGARLSTIRRAHSANVTRAYVEANLDGQRWIADFAREHQVPFAVEPAVSYAQDAWGLRRIDAEFAAAREAGLPVERVEALPVPFPFAGGVSLAGQLALDPVVLADALAEEFARLGGTLITGVRARGVRAGRPATVSTDHGPIRGDAVVVATAAPMLRRGLYFAKTRHSRSYLAAFRVPEAPPVAGLFLSVDAPTRSIRTTPDVATGGPPLLLVGGGGHPVGRVASTRVEAQRIVAWTNEYFDAASPVAAWSAQDYESLNLVPFVGRMPRGRRRIWIATGYAKWGLTNGAAAGLRISAEILGESWREHRPWVRVLGTRTTAPSDLARGIVENAAVGRELVSGWADALGRAAPTARPAEGEGVVVHRGGVPYGVSTVGGRTTAVCAVCPHTGGVVRWNDAESSWDCPLHGSRFEASGRLIEGPATRDLRAGSRRDVADR
ncbi:FAD-dependent oxidoreductase [Agromyces sp. NPDC058104]|uniref:FAD-dependent oxidoreductase n=1 Tax=Agromyces sp. NPDC058104 TaxID=3346342 RepID=UPI0036DD1C89